MNLRQRYRKLNLWSKIGLWGSLASFIGLLLVLIPGLANLPLVSEKLVQEGIIPVTGDSFYDVYYPNRDKG